MPHFCGIIKCGNRSDRDKKSFYRLPSILSKGGSLKINLSVERRNKWLNAIRRFDLTETKKSWLRVCEDHFITGKPADLLDVNHPDWVPSQNMGYTKRVYSDPLKRYQRVQDRASFTDSSIVGPIQSTSSSVASMDVPVVENTDEDAFSDIVSVSSISCQTEMTISDIENLEKAHQDTVVEICNLKDKLKDVTVSESSFENDDVKTQYYTGISKFTVLMILFTQIAPFLVENCNSSLSKFQQFMLTLMHIRLNLDITDLSYRFGISKSTASITFRKCLYVMFRRMQKFIVWPDRSILRERMPDVFLETFGERVTVIIDCFEIFIEKPSNLQAAAQTYSNYKQHHTIKYLIGISPQGSITFISNAWGGRTSDKFIVQRSGILEKLLPGDLILADRGFNVKEEVQLYCAEIQVPAYTKGKKQLSAVEVEYSRNLSRVRIHVERVIGALRQKFRILHNVMPISTVSRAPSNVPALVNQIVYVCCALTNISPSVVPFN